jgi:hypothetical protein
MFGNGVSSPNSRPLSHRANAAMCKNQQVGAKGSHADVAFPFRHTPAKIANSR